MTLFFDRDVGIRLPRALLTLKLPTSVEYHQKHFSTDEKDDYWMAIVGAWSWTLIGHDSSHHLEATALSAIKQHGMGCFYLWGSQAKRWEKMRCFLRAYEEILIRDRDTPRPFIFRVTETGRLRAIAIP